MKQTSLKKRILAVCLLIITSIFIVSCTSKSPEVNENPIYTADTALGSGENTFDFKVVNYEGEETAFTISTDKTTVGEALVDVGLIEGDEGPYGLYVKKVNGIRADYDIDKKYWAFYIDGAYATESADKTIISPGTQYAFIVE